MPNALRDDAPAGWHGAAGKAAACLLVAALLAVTGALTLAHVRTAERIATLEGEVALLTSHSDVSHLDTRLAHVGKEAKTWRDQMGSVSGWKQWRVGKDTGTCCEEQLI